MSERPKVKMPSEAKERPKAKMPVEEIRRASLRKLVEDYPGSKQEFAKLMPFGPARLSQLIGPNSTERFSEGAAAAIEKALSLTPGSMSRAGGPEIQDRGLDRRQAAEIATWIGQTAMVLGVVPTVEIVQEIMNIAADNAKRTGHVDTNMVASLTRALLSK